MGFGEQHTGQEKEQPPPVAQGLAQNVQGQPGGEGGGGLYLGKPQGAQGGGAVAEYGQQACQSVVVPHKEGEDEGGGQQSGGLEAVVPPKDLLAVLPAAGEIQNAGVHAGQTGGHHAEQDPLQQEAAEAGGLPEHQLRDKIEKAAGHHGIFVAQFVGQNPTGYLQQDAQGQGNALNKGDLGDGHPLRLPIEGGNGAVKDHALEQGDGIHASQVAFGHKKSDPSCLNAQQGADTQRQAMAVHFRWDRTASRKLLSFRIGLLYQTGRLLSRKPGESLEKGKISSSYDGKVVEYSGKACYNIPLAHIILYQTGN